MLTIYVINTCKHGIKMRGPESHQQAQVNQLSAKTLIGLNSVKGDFQCGSLGVMGCVGALPVVKQDGVQKGILNVKS